MGCGAGVGTAAGLITSGAINRAIDTQKAKKELQVECALQHGVFKDGKCIKDESLIQKYKKFKKGVKNEVILNIKDATEVQEAGNELLKSKAAAANTVADVADKYTEVYKKTADANKNNAVAVEKVAGSVVDIWAAVDSGGATTQTSVLKNKFQAQAEAKQAENASLAIPDFKQGLDAAKQRGYKDVMGDSRSAIDQALDKALEQTKQKQ